MEMKRLCPRVLILIFPLFAFCQRTVAFGGGEPGNYVILLGMEENSAAYIFTQSEESDYLAIQYLLEEAKQNEALARAWNHAKEKRAKFVLSNKSPVPKGLKEEHVVSVIAYTLNTKLYTQFNQAVRMYGANDSVYAEKFPFKSFHYLLSVAIERLRESSGSAPGTTYRGMGRVAEGQKGDEMRFGYFTSTSLDINVAKGFGSKTFITIKSRYGANIENYSSFPGEKEVLIPPYEVFTITELVRRVDGVDISLTTAGEKGIQVNVERGESGTMRVVRSDGAVISAVAWVCVLALLGPISL
ncbi:ecto-ADP-ribosyltransferase 5-like [Pristis pectinata]|uniref:ecto-ADP-ribosyltransferase 5-like n=1 Tax=Pristis pectinata TaxID=685728 RepID=UPI00223CCF8C|nr:ecto-ADP-ribosyltransferase 5-like [Pristis pectinata]